jgi:hypothetical protein
MWSINVEEARGIFQPMATRATNNRKSVSLTVVIDELQLILDLSAENPKDPRLAQLVRDAKEDFALALKKFPGGDDLPSVKNQAN